MVSKQEIAKKDIYLVTDDDVPVDQNVEAHGVGGVKNPLQENLDANQKNISNLAKLNAADIANAASGQVPKAQGDGTMAFGSVGGGIWTHDGTQTGSGNSFTYTLSASYDHILVFVEATDTAASNLNVDLRANGDSGTNYAYTPYNGTESTGATEWAKVFQAAANVTSHASFALAGRWGWGAGVNTMRGAYDSANTDAGYNLNVTSPLSQFTLVRGAGTDWTVEVYGRDT